MSKTKTKKRTSSKTKAQLIEELEELKASVNTDTMEAVVGMDSIEGMEDFAEYHEMSVDELKQACMEYGFIQAKLSPMRVYRIVLENRDNG